MTDKDTDGVDDDDSSVISKDIAEGKIVSELTAANNIGTVIMPQQLQRQQQMVRQHIQFQKAMQQLQILYRSIFM